MNDQLNREDYLRQLLEDNFTAARNCRKLTAFLSDPALKEYFEKLSSKRSQFAMEISEEITFFGGTASYTTSASYDGISPCLKGDNFACLKKVLKLHKKTLGKYKLALSQISDGVSREVIIRHKAFIENSIFELKGLWALLKFRQKHRRSSGQSHAFNGS